MATATDFLTNIGRKEIFGLIFFLLLTTCLSAEWVFEEAFPPHSSVKGGLIHFKSENRFSNLQATFFHLESSYRAVLSLKGDPLTKKTETQISVDFGNGNIQKVDARVLKGGYKVALPKEISQVIANALAQNTPVTLTFDSYKETLTPSGFKDAWRAFIK